MNRLMSALPDVAMMSSGKPLFLLSERSFMLFEGDEVPPRCMTFRLRMEALVRHHFACCIITCYHQLKYLPYRYELQPIWKGSGQTELCKGYHANCVNHCYYAGAHIKTAATYMVHAPPCAGAAAVWRAQALAAAERAQRGPASYWRWLEPPYPGGYTKHHQPRVLDWRGVSRW